MKTLEQRRLDDDFESETMEGAQAASEIFDKVAAKPANEETAEFKALVQQALAVQDASNLCGIAQTFATVMTKLVELDNANERKGTAWRNSNAVTRLWASKFESMAGSVKSEDWQG